MSIKVNRVTVDLSAYPDLVVIFLGMRAKSLRGLFTMFKIGPKINSAVAAKPEGLGLREQFTFSLFPPHLGMGALHAASAVVVEFRERLRRYGVLA